MVSPLYSATLSPPLPSTSNAAAASAPISEEESALLADEHRVQQETDDLERLLAAKHQQCEELVEKWKAVQTKREEETKVRARTLAEAAMAEVRQAAKRVNEHAKDAAWKAMEELQRLQSPAKGKRRLVSIGFLLVVTVLKFSTGQCHASESEGHAGESEGHAGDGEGFTSSCKEWRVEVEGEYLSQ